MLSIRSTPYQIYTQGDYS